MKVAHIFRFLLIFLDFLLRRRFISWLFQVSWWNHSHFHCDSYLRMFMLWRYKNVLFRLLREKKYVFASIQRPEMKLRWWIWIWKQCASFDLRNLGWWMEHTLITDAVRRASVKTNSLCCVFRWSRARPRFRTRFFVFHSLSV